MKKSISLTTLILGIAILSSMSAFADEMVFVGAGVAASNYQHGSADPAPADYVLDVTLKIQTTTPGVPGAGTHHTGVLFLNANDSYRISLTCYRGLRRCEGTIGSVGRFVFQLKGKKYVFRVWTYMEGTTVGGLAHPLTGSALLDPNL